MYLSGDFFSILPVNIKPDVTKHFTIFKHENGKKACFSGKKVQLLEYNPDFGPNFVKVSEEEAKQKHLGKMRCIGSIFSEHELLTLFSKYFDFKIPDSYTPSVTQREVTVVKEKKERIKKEEKRKTKIVVKADQLPQDRDEKDLIKAFRETEDKKKQNRIFNTILFQRGVNGKTWDQIIRNYVSFNRHRFTQFQDRTETDFYQDIVIALHKQVAKWFDVESSGCFSTYAWYVINCAFNRVLQLLSTKKRKTNACKIELDDPECSWDEIISSEKTHIPQSNFEEELMNKDLCKHIQMMFQLKTIDASDELKQEVLQVIRDKSTMQNSLYSLAKKYNVDVNDLFHIERDLRENLRNSMYNDIIRNMKYDINGDDEIAKKYKRSKGHVIKMKRMIVSTVKTKLKGLST